MEPLRRTVRRCCLDGRVSLFALDAALRHRGCGGIRRLAARCAVTIVFAWLIRGASGLAMCGLWIVGFLAWCTWDSSCCWIERERELQRDLTLLTKVAAYACGGQASEGFVASEASRRFADVRVRTHCVFASKAVVWGNDWIDGLHGDEIAQNVARCLPRFHRFCLEVRSGAALDAFVFEIRGGRGQDLASFAQSMRQVLAAFSRGDPAGLDCMSKSYIGRRGWHFHFAREPFFITSFAPCYTASHPRYQFGLHPDSCFVLFQPEEAFLRHGLPNDKPRRETNWDEPQDVRDRIRANFKNNGREYLIPQTVSYPPAHFIVSAMDPLNDPPVEFWKANLTEEVC